MCRGTFWAARGQGRHTGEAPAMAAMLCTLLTPWLGPREVVGQHGIPQPLGGAERRLPGGCSASAFPFHPLPAPVPFQPEMLVSLLFSVGFLVAFFYYFNLGTVIIFSII